ncbi:hypothetical protein [Polaribacter staleyi]|uniref:hypothetical protein n=1 Tax=Polaribacter staleyi TaxID=2022337 RepID=UPI0031B9EAA0
MVSDVEYFIDKNFLFENAFKATILKWDKHFDETTSFYFGLQYNEAEIVVKNAVKIFKPFYFIYLVAYSLPVIIFTNFNIVLSKNTINNLNQIVYTTSATCLIYLLYIIVSNIKSKVKTTYSYILKTQYLSIIFIIISLIRGNYFNDNGVFLGFFSAGFAVTYICHYFYKKHKEAIKKYKIL